MNHDGNSTTRPVVVLTGATGYVGGLILEPLTHVASEVRCLTRDPSKLHGSIPAGAVVLRADLASGEGVEAALRGADIAYYLVHSLDETGDFAQLEERSARNFADAARRGGVRTIIYLGALGTAPPGEASEHIESRSKVGEILKSSGAQVIEFRSAIVIGASSMPFEVIRALVERLPVMVTPRWVNMPVQPIASRDLAAYLLAAVNPPRPGNHVYEIAGGEVVSFRAVMRTYGRARRLKRLMIPVPVVTPSLSSWWLRLVTPARYRIARRIVDGIKHGPVQRDRQSLIDFEVRPMKVKAAIDGALADETSRLRFLSHGRLAPVTTRKSAIARWRDGNVIVERRSRFIRADRTRVFGAIARIGGETGWYSFGFLWRLRFAMDRVVAGVGGRRRARKPGVPVSGDTVDLWTVLECKAPVRLRLRADMRLPGRAWLQLEATEAEGGCVLTQTAAFDPKGLLGLLYWWLLYPVHAMVFGGMLSGLERFVMLEMQDTPAR